MAQEVPVNLNVNNQKANQSIDQTEKKVEELNQTGKKTKKGFSEVGEGLMGVFGPLPGIITDGIERFKSLKKAIFAVNISMRALTKVAISSGIGALVVALGSLIAFFTQTRKGANLLGQAFAAVSGVTDVFIQTLADFGEAIVEAFKNPVGFVEDLNKALKNPLKTVKSLWEGIKNFGQATSEAASESVEAEKKLQSLEETMIMLERSSLKVEKQSAKLKSVFEDEANSTKDRMKALEKFGSKQQKQLDKEIKAKQEELKQTKKQHKGDEDSIEFQKKINELKREIIEREKEKAEVEEETATKKFEIQKEELENEQELRDLRLQLNNEGAQLERKQLENQFEDRLEMLRLEGEEESELFNLVQKKKNQALREFDQERREEAIKRGIESEKAQLEASLITVREGSNEFFDLQKQIAKKEFKLKIRNEELTDEEIEKLRKEHKQNLAQIERNRKNEDLENKKLQLQNKLMQEEEGSEKSFELQRKIANKEMEIALNQENLTAAEKKRIKLKNEKKLSEIENKEVQKRIEKNTQNLRKEIEKTKEGSEERFKLQRQLANKRRRIALDQENLTAKEREKIENRHQKRLTEIDKKESKKRKETKRKEEAAKMTIEKKSFDLSKNLIELGIKNDEKARKAKAAVALAELAIDTARAISKGIATSQTAQPFPANIAAIATTITAVVSNIARAKKILSKASGGGGGGPDLQSSSAVSGGGGADTRGGPSTGSEQVENAKERQKKEKERVKVQVVESDITQTQDRIEVIENSAEV